MASYPPKKGVAFTIYLPILDADGDLVASATALTSTLSGDGAAFAAGPTPADEGEGFYSIAMTTAQMNFDNISGVLKTTTTGAKNTPFSIYTVTRQIDDLAFPTVSGRGIDVTATGEVGLDWANIGGATSAQTLSGTSTKAVEPTTAGRTLDVSAAGEAGIDWANIGGATSAAVLSGTTIGTLTTYTGNTVQTGDAFARLGAPAGASVSADIAIIEGQTDDIGVAGAGLTAIPWNATWDAEVESEVDDALGAGTGTALTAIPWNAAWDTEVQSEVTDALTAALTEGYATDGSTASVAQLLYMIWSALAEFAIASTTITAKKLDGTTTAMTFTLDDATNPTSRTRAT